MTNSRLRWASVLGFVIASLVGSACRRTIDVNDKRQYTHIKAFDGRLSSVVGLVHANVYVLSARGDDPMDDNIKQNRIELSSETATASEFRWPDNFGAGWCEIVDLDKDGLKEFVFVDRTVVRVVSFRDGKFVYRPMADEFIGQFPVRMIDWDGDGGLELLSYAPPLLDLSAHKNAIALLEWNFANGFRW